MIRILDREKNKIIECAQNRGVEYFVHFTALDNLKSILENGLCSREFMDKGKIEYCYNDEYRLDNFPNSISLSVTSPNYKMFYKLRKYNPMTHWVVLEFDAMKVLELDCAFCFSNAACSEVASIPILQRMTSKSFEQMFYEREDVSREVMKLNSFETTDPQAEILTFENIPSSYIEYINFQFFDDYIGNKDILNNYEICGGISSSFFYPRRDYNYW